ncbi:EAL domain-containing protein [Vibrio cholerae]|uniref:EAL domain-containing protein n=1 Tax=Vibrio cholerae TaxID=666 RepID=UPI0023E1E7E8|nr:EAL domain-containing protein [Vibrio cholerae]
MPTCLSSRRVTIGVVMPMLSGFYMGEISATFRQLAEQEGVNLIIIRSGDSRDFSLPIALHQMDALVVVLHAAANTYVEAATRLDIPVISMGASYSPLPVEQFSSLQSSGVEQLYQWLVSLGHQYIGFCGDLFVTDIRSRFNAFKQCVERYHHRTFDTSQLFSVENCQLAGGRQAAEEWLTLSSNRCTAVICATDQNALGMIEQLKLHNIDIPNDLAVVGIDNIFSGCRISPPLTTVDQQLEQLTRAVFQRALERIAGVGLSREVSYIEQSLVIRQSCGSSPLDKSLELDRETVRHALLYEALHSPSELFDNLYSLAKGGFQSILDAQTLYQCQLKRAELHRYEQYRLTSQRSLISSDELKQQESDPQDVRNLPYLEAKEASVITLLPVNRGEQGDWDVVTVVEKQSCERSIAQSAMFYNYLDILSLFIERDALIETSQQRHKKSQQLLQQLKVVSSSSNDGIWEWDLQQQRLYWNGRLSVMLRFTQSNQSGVIDPQLFLNRIHPEDIVAFEQMIQEHLNTMSPFKMTLRLSRDDGHYIWVQMNGSAIRNHHGLPVRIVGSMIDITEQQESADKIHQMAYFDGLTGIANRRKVMEVIEKHIKEQPEQPRAVMMMDLNRFKMINDTFGHQVGDALLRHVAEALTKSLRSQDLIGRFGGDEFVFFCDVVNAHQASELALRLLRAVEKPMCYQNIELVSQASIGVAFYPSQGINADELIKNADIAMYRAKQMGGGKVMHYEEKMHQPFESHLQTEHLLSQAIEQGEIKVHYQPLYDNRSKQICSVEALARWSSPTLGVVPPNQFIAVAENSFLMMKLGDCIIDRVCQDVVSSPWLRSLHHISVNISARQLVHSHFTRHLLDKINAYRLPPSLFCLEITETAAISDKEMSYRTLRELQSAGFSLSLDDFGTGFSSLSLLKGLPIKEVKIDRSFINDISEKPSNLAFIKGLVSMVQSLGFRVVAEGVETLLQMEVLSELDIDIIQGFYFSKPKSLAELEAEVNKEQVSET